MNNNVVHKIKISIIDTNDGKKIYETKRSSSDNSFSKKLITNIPTKKSNKRKFNENDLTKKSKTRLNREELSVVETLGELSCQRIQEIILNRKKTLSEAHDYFKQKNYEAAFAEYIVLYFRLRDFDQRDNDRAFPSLQFQALKGTVISYYKKDTLALLKKPTRRHLKTLFSELKKNNEPEEVTRKKFEQELDYIQKIIGEAESILASPSPSIELTNKPKTTGATNNTNRDS